jgi:IS1 family transposase/transposase-like protein
MLDHSIWPILPHLCWVCYLTVLCLLFWHWRRVLHPPKPVKKQPRSNPGPTKRPPCPVCQAEDEAQKQMDVPPVPPPPIEQTRGRPREVDTSSHYCPDEKCRYYGWAGLGNIRSNGHPNGGRWRQLQCTVCGKCFMETSNTIFFGKRVSAEIIWRALKALAEGLDIRATARVFEVDPNTVEKWLRQAATHMEAVSQYLIHDLHLTQVQVDELWALLGKRDEGTGGKHRATRWVWAGIDPVSKLLLAYVVGDRSVETAQILIHLIAGLLAPGCLPLFLSDQWSPYATALLTHFGHWVKVPRRHPRGRRPKPRWRPLPGLLYAQVVKRRVKGRVVEVSHRVVYGSLEVVEAILKQSLVSQVINTAFIERLNLSIRQGVAALGRKVTSLAKTENGLRNQLSLWHAYYNFCLPHSALRLPLPEPLPTRGNGSPKKWRQRTPAMAAGSTDRIWRMEQLLLFRVPPWPSTQPAQTMA